MRRLTSEPNGREGAFRGKREVGMSSKANPDQSDSGRTDEAKIHRQQRVALFLGEKTQGDTVSVTRVSG